MSEWLNRSESKAGANITVIAPIAHGQFIASTSEKVDCAGRREWAVRGVDETIQVPRQVVRNLNQVQ